MRVLPLASLALAFAWNKSGSDTRDPVQTIRNALTELKSKVGGLPKNWDTEMGLPDGWTYQDAVNKCTPSSPHFDSTLSPIDCVRLFPHILDGYMDKIQQMEDDFKAANPPPLTPVPVPDDDAASTEGAPTSFLETHMYQGLQDLIKRQQKQAEMEEARDTLMNGMTAAQKEHVKKESAEILAAMQNKDHAALKRLGVEADNVAAYHTNRMTMPTNVQDEIKRLGRMSLDLNREYVLEQKRNGPIIADLKDIQEQEKVVQREQKEENDAMVEKAKERARIDWERAHTPAPPQINPGSPNSPGYQSAVARMWKQAEERAQEQEKHAAEEKAEEEAEVKMHMTPGPAARLQAKLSARLTVDDEELEGQTPSEDQLLAAGFITTTVPPANGNPLVEDPSYRKMAMHLDSAHKLLNAASQDAMNNLNEQIPEAKSNTQASSDMAALAAQVTGRTGLDVRSGLVQTGEKNMRKH